MPLRLEIFSLDNFDPSSVINKRRFDVRALLIELSIASPRVFFLHDASENIILNIFFDNEVYLGKPGLVKGVSAVHVQSFVPRYVESR